MSDDVLLSEWPEIKRVVVEKRCELSLNAVPDGKRKPDINDEQLQNRIFASDTPLNSITLTRLGLNILHSSVGKVSKLTKLTLHTNALVTIPEDIGNLKELQFIDLSTNQLEKLPAAIGSLPHLSTLLLAHNKISSLPDMAGLVSLQHLDVSHNQLTEFPTSFPSHSKLQTLALNSNHIKELPTEVEAFSDALKTVNLSDNEIVDLPYLFCNYNKIKTLELANNKFSDNRFKRLAEDPRHKNSAALIEYLKKKRPKKGKDRSGMELGSDINGNDNNECASSGPEITVNYGMNSISIERTKEASEIRPYIVCCILKNCSLNAEKVKQLLIIQNKLHSSICGERTIASIGTHDCHKIQPPLTYGAIVPDELMITPLHRHKRISGRELVSNLANEAELVRKKEKRNVVSNVHKYIYLIQKLPLYPCLMDADGLVISIPPVTNCEETKLELDTKDILVEVTSSMSQNICGEIMDEFIKEVVKHGVATNLIIEQIKVTQHTGELLVAYPGKNDLQMRECTVKRELLAPKKNETHESARSSEV